jgi:hypothetical protein
MAQMVTDDLEVSVDLQPRSAGRCQMGGLEVQVTITPLAAVRKRSPLLVSLRQSCRCQHRSIFNANVH